MSEKINNRQHYLLLDAVRGLAAIIIAIFHLKRFFGWRYFHPYLAVDLFFMLSGFVIAAAYEEKLRTEVLSFRGFLWTRWRRLYPMYIVSLVVALIAFAVGTIPSKNVTDPTIATIDPHLSWSSLSLIGVSFLLLPAFGSLSQGAAAIYPFNVAYWSLEYEVLINIIYGLIQSKLTTKRLAIVVITLMSLLTCAAYFIGNLDRGALRGWDEVACGFLRSGFGIFCGILLFRCRNQLFLMFKNLHGIFQIFFHPWLLMGMVLIAFHLPSFQAWNYLFDCTVVFLLFPLFILIASQSNISNQHLVKLMRWLGEMSYPLYLLHLPVSWLIGYALARLSPHHMLKPIDGVITIAVCMVLSVIDKPLRACVQ